MCRIRSGICCEYSETKDSAGGSAKQGRNSKFQAILPLRGKVLNIEKSDIEKMAQNAEIKSIISALGCGIGNDLKIENLNYHKIIIMTDADADGGHIKSLLLTFFYRYMKPLVDNGYVYVANPPLFRIQDGKKVTYAYSDKEKEIILDKSKAPNVQRYKGLGEMNPEQLWETTMDPATRVLFRIKILDNYKTEETFINLMGENTEYRKAFIQKNGGKINIGEDI